MVLLGDLDAGTHICSEISSTPGHISAYVFPSQNKVTLGDFNSRICCNSEILMPEERRVEIFQCQNKLFVKFDTWRILIG
jgi:hypothetical protein